jgi:DNA ligase-1
MTAFADLVSTSRRVADTGSRNAKTSLLAAFLRRLAPEEIPIGVAYLSGETRQGRSGIGYALLRDAASAPPATVPSLTIADVDAALAEAASMSGSGSRTARTRLLAALLARAASDERDFLFRLFTGELRQGALESLMIDAVAAAASLSAARVREAAMVAHGIVDVAHAALIEGEQGLARYALAPMQPIAPMLAQPADDIGEAMRALGGSAAFEWKLDGARVQVHRRDDDVRVFTRNRNDVTASAPEIVEAVRAMNVHELILDGEAIALQASGAPEPFQVTMRRFGRTQDVAQMQDALPLSVFFFDCLRVDDRILTGQPARERFAAMSDVLPATLRMPRIVTADEAEATAFYDDALRRGHEGVMAKALDAPYEAGRRAPTWLKVKRLHTLDLVVLAAEWGHGRRRGFLSNLHLGARDDAGGFTMLGKTFKGMTDDMLGWQTSKLQALATSRDDGVVFVRPDLVVEIAFNDLQASPRYPGGLALRFARVKRYRPDKRVEDADTMETVRAIYENQLARGNQGN